MGRELISAYPVFRRTIQQSPSVQNMSIASLACLVRNQDARESMQTMASSLIHRGCQVNLGVSTSRMVLTPSKSYQIHHHIHGRTRHDIGTSPGSARNNGSDDTVGTISPGSCILVKIRRRQHGAISCGFQISHGWEIMWWILISCTQLLASWLWPLRLSLKLTKLSPRK